MDDTCTYLIRLHGHLYESEIYPSSPLQITLKQVDEATLLEVQADQAGLIGLMRYLHGKGFVILSMTRMDRMTIAKGFKALLYRL